MPVMDDASSCKAESERSGIAEKNSICFPLFRMFGSGTAWPNSMSLRKKVQNQATLQH